MTDTEPVGANDPLSNVLPKILRYPDPRLRMVCDPVPERLITSVRCWAMLEAMKSQLGQLGYGLAAPQIGAPVRAIIVHVPGGCLIELINPEIVKQWGGKYLSDEGCLSYPGNRVRILRHKQIKVKGFDRYGKPVAFGGKNLQAAALQHEIDHLNGINIADYQPGTNKLKKELRA